MRIASVHGLCVMLLLASVATAEDRQWSDLSGLYRVNASLVTADDRLVVLRQSDGELVILKREQLSEADQEYLSKNSDGLSSAKESEKKPVADATTDEKPITTADGVTDIPSQITRWRLRSGGEIRGQLVGFASQMFTIRRVQGKVLVNEIALADLPAAFDLILPAVVSKIDNKPIVDRQELEKHIASGGGGPFAYTVNGVQVQLEEGSTLTIPIEFLESGEANLVMPGFKRWLAAREGEVAEDDRYNTDSRERLMLDSYARLRGPDNVAERNYRQLELGLLTVNAGITEIWEVALLPNAPYGYPRSVLIPGRDSATAEQIALRQYPGWQVAYVKKLSD